MNIDAKRLCLRGGDVKWPVFPILASFMLQSCSSVIAVRPDEPLNNDRVFNYAQLQARSEGSSVTIVTADSLSYEGDSLHVSQDTLSFVDRSDRTHRQLSTRQISKVIIVDHATGALTGALVGSLAGAVAGIGFLLAAVRGSSEGGPGLLVLELGAIGLGALIGATIGLSNGSSVEYHLHHDN